MRFMMWMTTSGRTLLLPPALVVIIWACATLAWTTGEKEALSKKIRDFNKRHGEIPGARHDDDDDGFIHPHPLEGSCVDHDGGCPEFAKLNGCSDAHLAAICVKSCTSCVPVCIDTGFGCTIIKIANLCNKFYIPICKKTCGACTVGPTPPPTTATPTSPPTTVSTTTTTTPTTTTPPTTESTTTTTIPTTTTTTTTTPTTTESTTTTTTSTSTTTSTTTTSTTTTTIPPTTIIPPTVPTTTTSTTTDDPGECNHLLATTSATVCNFSKFPKSHTTNKKMNKTCGITKSVISDAEKVEIIRLHNEFRAKVANGQETEGKGGGQPSGSNMRELTWSDELAVAATAWAKQCPFLKHDTYSNRRTCKYNVVGQNIYYTWSNKPHPVWDRGIGRWYTEVKDVPESLVSQYTELKATVGHYTQIVWAETVQVGCGAVSYKTVFRGFNFKHAKIYVCNYATAGNIIDQPIYEVGPPASNCGAGFTPSTCNPGLCSTAQGTMTLRGYYPFLDKVYTEELGDPNSNRFKELKKLKEDKFAEEYRKQLGDDFVDFKVIAFRPGNPGVIIECILIVKEDTEEKDILEATKNIEVPGGLVNNIPENVFKPPPPPGCKFTASIPERSSECSYSNFGNEHTANLKKNCSCEVHTAGITAADKEEILSVHNNYRSNVAQGKEKRGNPAPQPAGANIKELVWNDQLADLAQIWKRLFSLLQITFYRLKLARQHVVIDMNILFACSSLPMSIWWSTVSNAFDRSIKIPNVI
ncbi:unnamed protein product, partial [Meganyctiphanes norvegica]